jgi:hypothetical protein
VSCTAPGFIEFKQELLPSGGEHQTLHAKLVEGGVLQVKSNIAARILVDGKQMAIATSAALPLSEGKHTLTLRAQKPFLRYETQVQIDKGRTVDKQLAFGTVEVKAPGVTAHPEGAEAKGVTVLALPAGSHTLRLSNREGERKDRDLVVEPSVKVVIDTW